MPLHVEYLDGSIFISEELRPRAGQTGVYGADYGIFLFGSLAQYGSFSISLPSTDANGNSIPDLVELARPYSGSGSGNGRSDWPQAAPFVLSAQFNRLAGSDEGTFSGSSSSSGGTVGFTGTMRIPHVDGTAQYTRDIRNTISFELLSTDSSGNTDVLAGSTAYMTPSPNKITLPQFNVTGPHGTYTLLPASLTRSGNRYVAVLRPAQRQPLETRKRWQTIRRSITRAHRLAPWLAAIRWSAMFGGVCPIVITLSLRGPAPALDVHASRLP